ncbi:MAG: SDR family oxidoreductase [Acidobacteriota bacterium]|nr:SDR family oxidoreductase [Blastocatellia bacterium]MDW8411245.1 SDR family oxidoreductase [Acidobacteriota bacterium]
MHITGTRVMITGGARIGRGVARHLAEQGASSIVLTYKTSKDVMIEAAAELQALGTRSLVYRMDVTSEDEINAVVNKVYAELGGLDVLINMASIYKARAIGSLSLQDWREDLDSNATGTFLCMRAVAPRMYEQGSGRIINFVDWTVASRRVDYKHYATYYAAKHAILGLTEAYALEYAPKVLVNCIAPGPILPPAELNEAEAAAILAETPLGRWGGSEEIAEAVAFLIRTNFVTGECIRVDGGRHLK